MNPLIGRQCRGRYGERDAIICAVVQESSLEQAGDLKVAVTSVGLLVLLPDGEIEVWPVENVIVK